MRKFRLSRGETGNLEVWSPEGELVGYVCEAKDAKNVLDLLLAEYTSPTVAWAHKVVATHQAAMQAAKESSWEY
jgi:hypothetical protein